MRRSSDTLEAVTAWIRDAANVELFTVSGTTVTGAMLVTVAVVVLVGFAASRAVRVAARHCLRRRGLQGPLEPGSFVSLQEDKSAGWGDVDPSRLSLTASSRRPRDKATARPKTPDPIVASTVGTSSPRGHHAPDPPTTPCPPDPEVEASAPDRGARRGSFARLADPCVGPARTVDRGAWPCPPPEEPAGAEREFAALQTDLKARREVAEGQARWAIARAESRRAALLDEERSFIGSLAGRRRVPPEQLDVERKVLTLYREADQLLSESIEQWDRHVSALLEATSFVRQLQIAARAPIPPEARLAALRGLLATLQTRLAASRDRLALLDEQRAAVDRGLEAARGDVTQRRSDLLARRLATLNALPDLPHLAPTVEPSGEDTDPGATVEDQPGVVQEAASVPPAMEQLDAAELAVRALAQRQARVELMVAERRVEQTRLQIDEIALEQELAAVESRVLEAHAAVLTEEVRSLAAFEEGGLLSRGPSPLAPERWRAITRRSLEVAAHPADAYSSAAALLRPRTEMAGRGALLLLTLAALLGLGLAIRTRARLADREVTLLPGRFLVGTARGFLLVGPLCVVPLGALLLQISQEEATPLLAFLAFVPALAAAALGGLPALAAFEEDGVRAAASRSIVGLARGAISIGLLFGLLIAVSPLVGYSAEAPALLKTVLGGLWLLLLLALLPHRREALRLLEVALATQLPRVLRDALLRLYLLLALLPLAAWVLYAAGLRNLAGFLLQGGVVTVSVLLLTPGFWHLVSGLGARIAGFPEGGGPLSLTPNRSAAVYRAMVPLGMAGTFGIAALTVASGWGYGGLLANARATLGASLLKIGGSEISIGRLLLFAGTVGATLMVARWLVRILHDHLYPLYDLDRGLATTIDTLVRYTVVCAGIVVGLDVVGVGIGVLTVFAGVVGIGVGFGSQKLAANFISGLILLIARPVAVGDTIEVGGLSGRVLRISSYATVLETLDKLTVIVPNSAVVDESVINWSIFDRQVRLEMKVGVAYGSDTSLVERLLLQSVEGVDGVLVRPAPEVRFEDFGDSALVFSLLPWTNQPDNRRRIVSRLRFKVDALFREHGVEIAFPQMDIHVRSGDGVLELAARNGWEVCGTGSEGGS